MRLTPQLRLEPDLLVIPTLDGRVPRANDPVTSLQLAAEVLSPESARHDRITKRRFLHARNVPVEDGLMTTSQRIDTVRT